MLKLKLQYFGHLMRRVDSLEVWRWEGLGAGGEEDNWGCDGWMASRTRWIWVWVNSGRWCWTGRPGVWQFMGLQRVGHDWATELNWTDNNNDCSWKRCNTQILSEEQNLEIFPEVNRGEKTRTLEESEALISTTTVRVRLGCIYSPISSQMNINPHTKRLFNCF